MENLQDNLNSNIDAEFTGLEGNMLFFLSETTKLEANWLLLDHEVTSDTMLINYLNPAGAPVARYLGAVDPDGTGMITGAVHTNGRVLFKSAGFNCTVAGLYTDGCATGEPGWAESIKGNGLPGSSDKSYGLSLTQDFMTANGVTSARLSYRYRGAFDSDIFNMERMKIELEALIKKLNEVGSALATLNLFRRADIELDGKKRRLRDFAEIDLGPDPMAGTFKVIIHNEVAIPGAISILKENNFKFVHVSTDEVFGSLGEDGYFTEDTSYDPSSPYSASKASSNSNIELSKITSLPLATASLKCCKYSLSSSNKKSKTNSTSKCQNSS